MSQGSSALPALGVAQVTKRFGATLAVDRVTLSVATGEVHALVGENGAGKSTLMRLVAGLYQPDSGEIVVKGEPFVKGTPALALARGIGMVHQHFMLVPALTVAENVMLGREPKRGPWLDLLRAEAAIAELSERYQLFVDPRRRVEELAVGEAQRVEIIKVLYRGADLVILDEPTAVLTPLETEQLFAVIRGLCAGGKTAILITHKLDEVMAISQHITVMQRGRVVGELETAKTSAAEVARAMVGREVLLHRRSSGAGAAVVQSAPAALALTGVSVAREGGGARGESSGLALSELSLTVGAGEIVGIAGVEGNGQSELALCVMGLVPLASGSVSIGGTDLTRASTKERLAAGVGYIPEDRHLAGLVLDMSIAENSLLGHLERFAGWGGRGPIRQEAALEYARALIAENDVRPTDPTQPVRGLSGGNQQKIVIGRALSGGEKPLVLLVAAQPTRGVDIGAVERIHEDILRCRAAGAGVLLLSADLDEILALADRIAVLYRGRIVATVDAASATPAGLGVFMSTGSGTADGAGAAAVAGAVAAGTP